MGKKNYSLIELCNRFGVRIYQYRFVLWALSGVASSLVIFSVFFFKEDVYTLGSISLLLWILLIIVFSQVFSWQPPTADLTDPFLYRIVVKVKRGLFWLMLVILVGLFVFVFFVSTRAVSILL